MQEEYRGGRVMDKIILVSLMMCIGCASTGAPNGNPCKERSFDEWLSFYDLKDKANSSWDEGYRNAFVWLNDVAHACYPEKFVRNSNETIDKVIIDDTNTATKNERREEKGLSYQVPEDFFQSKAPDVPAF
jgi:hypothetical protein